MPRYTIQMIGIMYFHVCNTPAKRVLIPRGNEPGGHIPPHYASLFVERDLCKYVDWWPGFVIERDVKVEEAGRTVSVPTLEFRIPERVELTFDDQGSGNVTIGNLDTTLHKNSDPGFQLDLVDPDTIAEIPIRGGSLEAFTFGRGHAVQWNLQCADTMTFQAVSHPHGTRRGQVTVMPRGGSRGTEIVLLHSQSIFPEESRCGGHGHENHEHQQPQPPAAHPAHNQEEDLGLHHYKLYARLDRNRDESKVNFTPSLPHQAGIVSKLRLAELNNSCTPDCC